MMKPQICMPMKPCRSKTLEALATAFAEEVNQTTRRQYALERHFKHQLFRWRRAATTGPNADKVLIWSFKPWREPAPTVEIWPINKLDAMAAAVTDCDLQCEFFRLECAEKER